MGLLALSSVALGHYRENPDEATRPPQILREPDFTEIPLGEEGSLYVHAIGAGTLEYQWYYNFEPIFGATNDTFEIVSATREDAGLYQVSVTSEFGTAVSKTVRLRVDKWENIRAIDRTVTGDQSGKSTLAFFKGHFVTGGENGALSRSTDGYSWENLDPIPGNLTIEKLVPGQSRLLALLHQAGVVAWTGDFSDWNFAFIDEAIETVESIVHSQGIFAALVNTTTGTRLLTSNDGSVWEVQHDFVETDGSCSLSATDHFFVAAKSNENGTEFVSSSNGLEWVAKFDPTFDRVSKNYAFGDAAIIEDINQVYTSTNGSEWTILEGVTTIPHLEKTIQAGETYYGIFNNNIFESFDLERWDRVFTYFETPFGGDPIVRPFEGTFEHGNERIVYGPVEGSFYPIFDFNDFEIIETPNAIPSDLSLIGIDYLNNEFIIRTDDKAILVSGTGGNWELMEINFNIESFDRVEDLAFGNGIYANGNVFGLDLDQFELIRARIRSSFEHTAFGNGVFVGTNSDGAYYSEDGKFWALAASSVPSGELIFQNGRFIAIGEAASIETSEDGLNWTSAIIEEGINDSVHDFSSITFGGDQFIAAASSDTGTVIYHSSDGLTWSPLELNLNAIRDGNNGPLHHIDIAFGGGRFVLMFENWIFETADFQTWETFPFDTQTLFELQYGGGSFVGIGASGRIVQIAKPEGIPPSVSFRNRNTVSLLPSQKVELFADAYDTDGDVEKVEFSVDGEIVRVATSSPYDWEWSAEKTGVYELRALAIDDSGMTAMDALTVSVSRSGFVNQISPNEVLNIVDFTVFEDLVFGLSSNGMIYRAGEDLNWKLAHIPAFDPPNSLDSANGLVYAKSSRHLYITENGRDWKILDYRMPNSPDVVGNWFLSSIFNGLGEGESLKSRDLYNWHPLPARTIDIAGNIEDYLVPVGYTSSGIKLIDAWGREEFRSLPIDGEIFSPFGVVLAPIVRKTDTFDGKHFVWLDKDPFLSPGTVDLYVSEDTLEWSLVETPALSSLNGFEKVGELFIISGAGEISNHFVSNNEMQTWTPSDPVGPVLFHRDRYVGFVNNRLSHSENGIDWMESLNSLEGNGKILSFGNQYLALVKEKGLFVSSEGINWELAHPSRRHSGIHDIEYNGELYVAITYEYTMTSTDARNWEYLDKPIEMTTSLAYGNGVFVVTGVDGSVFRSTDGLDWTQRYVSDLSDEVDIVEFLNVNNEFILENNRALVATSIDGTIWAEPSDSLSDFSQIKPIGEFLFARSLDGRVFRSANGIDWAPAHQALDIEYPVFENNVYLSLTVEFNPSQNHPSLLRTEDGLTWEVVELPFHGTTYSLQAIESGFLITTNNDNRVGDYFSEDGETWVETLITLPEGFQKEIIEVDGERFQVIDPVGIPIGGPLPAIEPTLTKQSSDDLGLSIVRDSLEFLETANKVRIRLSVTNIGSRSVDMNAIAIDARISNENRWTEDSSNTLETHTLPDIELLPGESYQIPVEFSLPVDLTFAGRTLQLLLNVDQRIQEIDLSNNFAWLRLLPAPEISVENQHDETVNVSWSREGGYVTRIEYSYDLKNWFLLDAPATTTETGTYIENADPDRETFYRVRAE